MSKCTIAQAFLLAVFACRSVPVATPCESLTALKLPETTIVLAQPVAAGAFIFPAPLPAAAFPGAGPRGGLTLVAPKDLPAFCRVAAVVMPAKESQIKFEVWMPASNWNGKFIGIGNGGFAGWINHTNMTASLSRGFATASTDTGHEGGGMDASFVLGHPERVIDWGYRAVHEMTVKAKLIIAAYYGRPARFSYWNGCSTGGRQGLEEAQRFPADYDGIAAGAPANFITHSAAKRAWNDQAIDKNPAGLIPDPKLILLHKAVLQACDARDGVKDGILEDPGQCDFDPKSLQCKGEDSPECLTAPQVELARTIYGPAVNPRTKEEIYPGLALGSELGWGGFAWAPMAADRERRSRLNQYLRFVVFQDPSWDYSTFNFDSGVALADRLDRGIGNAMNPNLQEFFRRGGKLLQYHGWTDPGPSPLNSVNYYKSVVDFMGSAAKVQDSFQLFMVPGMDHCFGGEGPNTFDSISPLEQWVEKRANAGQIIAAHWKDGKIDRTRPLCPYPQVAKYKGTGSTDDAASFACVVP